MKAILNRLESLETRMEELTQTIKRNQILTDQRFNGSTALFIS